MLRFCLQLSLANDPLSLHARMDGRACAAFQAARAFALSCQPLMLTELSTAAPAAERA